MSLVEEALEAAAIRLHPNDNVVVAARRIARGARLRGEAACAAEPIPSGHKMATVSIPAGAPVLKYGQVIGSATVDIPAGAHVHTHNVKTLRWSI